MLIDMKKIYCTYEFLGFSIEMEARRNGREARRKAWHQMIGNVRNGLVDQVGRYLTYGGMYKGTGEYQLHVEIVLDLLPYLTNSFTNFL